MMVYPLITYRNDFKIYFLLFQNINYLFDIKCGSIIIILNTGPKPVASAAPPIPILKAP